MVYVLLCIGISVITGFLLTYFLATRYSILERLACGVVVGLALFTWIAYLFSLSWGLQYKSISLAVGMLIIISGSVIFIIKWASLKEKIAGEMREIKADFFLNKTSYYIHITVFSFFATIFCRLFYRTILWKADGMYIGLANNYGDLPLHYAYITSFVWGDNIPSQDPSCAGEKLAYPFLADFLSAIFLKLGLDFREILFIPGFLLTVVFYCIFYYFSYRLTKRRLAAIISTFIFFFTGGFGFYYFFQDIAKSPHVWSFLMNLPRDYTKIEHLNYRWITPLTCLNVPQRPFLFGFPITMLVFSLLYAGIEHKKWKEFLFAGILAGTLPLFHTHSFLAVLMVTLPLALIFWDWRTWLFFFAPAFVLSLPQALYLSENVGGGSFFKYNFGWVAGKDNVLWFWLKNTGLFWPLIIAGFATIFAFRRGTAPTCLRFYSLPFLLLFLLPNLMLFAPWDWDNIKILIYWCLGTSPIAALALVRLYENKRFLVLSRVAFFLLIFVLVLAGGIDVFRYSIAPIYGWKEFSAEEVRLARRIVKETPADAVFLNAPIFNHPVFLSGRKALMGYVGHIVSHGCGDAYKREDDVKKMLRGKPESIALLSKYKPHYAIVGPHEKRSGVNKAFFDTNYACIISTENYKIYDLNKKNESSVISVAPQRNRQKTGGKKYGLTVSYYDNMNWTGEAVYEEVDSTVKFHYSDEDGKPLFSPYSAIWKGYLAITTPGVYTFKVSSDDGSWLYIDDHLVVENGGLHPLNTAIGTVALEKGNHKIMIKYFDGGGGAVLRLVWIPPGGVEREVPVECFKVTDSE